MRLEEQKEKDARTGMAINSRRKGKTGELEWAKFLNKQCPNANARRGQQFRGTEDSPDVVSDLPFHWEVKRRQSMNLHDVTRLCKDESGYGKWPAVAHRKDNEPWLVTMDAVDFLKIVELLRPFPSSMRH